MEDVEDNKRTQNPELLDRAQIKAAFASIIEEMGKWQEEAIMIQALEIRDQRYANKRRLDLRPLIVDATLRFEGIVAELPQRLRDESRVTDLRRALAELTSRLG